MSRLLFIGDVMSTDKIMTVIGSIETQEETIGHMRNSIRKFKELLTKEVEIYLTAYPFTKIKWELDYSQGGPLRLNLPISDPAIQDLYKFLKMHSSHTYDRALEFDCGSEHMRIWWPSTHIHIELEEYRNKTLVETLQIFQKLGFDWTPRESFYQNIKIVRDGAIEQMAEFDELEKLIDLTPPES